jgi:hypothetical protein
MILLHHPESELSRALLAEIPSGVAVSDCSQGLPSDYTGPQPSAYPSVVLNVPAYMANREQLNSQGEFLGMMRVEVPAHQEILRMPATWAAVNKYTAFVAARAADNPVEPGAGA